MSVQNLSLNKPRYITVFASSEATWIPRSSCVLMDGWVVMMTDKRAGGSALSHSLFVVSLALHRERRDCQTSEDSRATLSAVSHIECIH